MTSEGYQPVGCLVGWRGLCIWLFDLGQSILHRCPFFLRGVYLLFPDKLVCDVDGVLIGRFYVVVGVGRDEVDFFHHIFHLVPFQLVPLLLNFSLRNPSPHHTVELTQLEVWCLVPLSLQVVVVLGVTRLERGVRKTAMRNHHFPFEPGAPGIRPSEDVLNLLRVAQNFGHVFHLAVNSRLACHLPSDQPNNLKFKN